MLAHEYKFIIRFIFEAEEIHHLIIKVLTQKPNDIAMINEQWTLFSRYLLTVRIQEFLIKIKLHLIVRNNYSLCLEIN